MFRFFTLLMIVAATLLSACKSGPQLLPYSSGKAGEVGIIMDKSDWEGELGAAMKATLANDYPFLPQREPLFTLFTVPSNAFSKIFQSHRSLVIVNVSPEFPEVQLVIQENVWAAPQIVATLSGPDTPSVLDCFEKQGQRLINAIEQAERNRGIATAKRYEEKSLRILVNESFGGSPYFPVGYALKKQEKDFIWISSETTYTTLGILVYTYPYIDSTSLSKQVMIRECNAVMRKEVPGPFDNTYMTIFSEVEPSLRWINFKNNDFAELRGHWEVENDYMGGPFITHFWLDVPNRRVLVLSAFVYAPRYDKRNYLRQVESILYSFEWVHDQEEQK